MKSIELFFERILWFSRLVIIIPVLFSLVLAFGMLYTTTLDAIALLGSMLSYGALDEAARSVAQIDSIVEIVSIVDKYLLGALMLLFGLGLYELYIGPINAIENSAFASRLLLIKSFDDLKDRLANVILLILAVKFFQQALSLKYETVNDLLILAIGTSLIGVSFFLTRKFFFQTRDGAASTTDKGK
ncbi:MAG: YqhA family protein [Chloroflexota bacterium]|nr:YqhA family protein [Chloroflexota bacterium]